MVNFGEAIKRPFQDAKKLIIGIVLSIIPIVNLIALGYMLENTKSVMKKSYKLTEWGHWGDLFVRGLMFAVIGFIYALPALIVFLIGFGAALMGTIGSAALMSPVGILTSIGGFGITLVAFIILALIAAYIIPAAALNYVAKNKFGAAFDFAEIKKRAFKSEYFTAWIVGELYMVVITLVLMWIPLIGAGIASFIGSLTAYTMLAEAFASK